jgi:hypothetical protein
MLSIGIVTYNSKKSIRQALESIIKNIPSNYEFSVVVIDNSSNDSSSSIIEEYNQKHSFFTYIQNVSNRGFAKAHNQAISTLKSRFHIICNPDISLATDIFTPLIEFMETHPRIGICCPKFLNSDNTLQPLNRRLPTVLDLVLRRLVPDSLKHFFK